MRFVGTISPQKLTIIPMTKVAANILSLNSKDALDFFMKSEHFHGFELPEYFDFTEVLDFVRKTVGDRPFDDCATTSPSDFQDVNFDILLNKDGRYAVRPLVLCNPYLYYFWAREIAREKNWETVKECFKTFEVPHIKSCAIPVIPNKKEKFHHSTTILNWWNQLEQRSIGLSLEYRYMFVTDITNCYGSINPQAIDWALSRRNTIHATDENHTLAQNIIRLLRDLQQGRNIGIPQGSALFDLTGEIILGYSDLLLHEALNRANITNGYEVIRYRDDYRIFCNDRDKLERISYILQQVLESLNFRMNSGKTKMTDSIVIDSIKPDKLGYIYNTPIFNKKGCDFDGLQKHLLYIMMFGRKYPNSGQLRTMLNDFDDRVKLLLEEKDIIIDAQLQDDGKVNFQWKDAEVSNGIIENIRAMSAICVQIAIDNINHAHYALSVASRMVDSIKDNSEKWDVFNKMCARMRTLKNDVYIQLWLQHITYQRDKKAGKCPYDARLCHVVMGENLALWNIDWLKPDLTKEFPQGSIINKETLAKVTPVIKFRKIQNYEEFDY